MNKAFTKEEDGTTLPDLPERPVPGHPNPMTSADHAALMQDRDALAANLHDLRATRDSADDLLPLAEAERDLRYVDAQLARAQVVDLAAQPRDRVAFGACVTVTDEDNRTHRFRIVNDMATDPAQGLIAPSSPLAQALMEQRVGDVVEWPRPNGTIELEFTDIAYPAEALRPSRTTSLAGLPATVAPAATSRVTTLPAPTIAPSPMLTPGNRIAAPPIQTCSPISTDRAISSPSVRFAASR